MGWPIAYYGLRMLDVVASAPAATESGTLTMTAVVAPCASVRRPAEDGGSEPVELDIHPDTLAEDARVRELFTTADCPYGVSQLVVALGEDGRASELIFGGEAHVRQ